MTEAGAKAQKDPGAAVAAFDAIAGDASVDPLFRDAARLRAALIRLDQPKDEQAGAAGLTSLAGAEGPFRRTARLALGALAISRGEYDEAAKQLDLVLSDPAASSSDRQYCRALARPRRLQPEGREALRARLDGPIDMSKVAIIGRPNVGKSTLFNRLVGRKLALVDDQPGVTRDRREGEARLADLAFTIVDTAGLEEGDPETLAGRMRAQTETALRRLRRDSVPDRRARRRHGGGPAFRAAVAPRRQAGSCVANKAEGTAGRDGVYDAYTLGLGEPIAFSAEHGEGLSDLYDALRGALPPAARLDPDEEEEAAPLVLGDEEDGSRSRPDEAAAHRRARPARTPASRRCSITFSARTGC